MEKPDPKLNFFQNYEQHLNFLQNQFSDKVKKFRAEWSKNNGKPGEFLKKEVLTRLSCFDPLRDGHDYFDEVVGATALPFVGTIGALGYLAFSIWESLQWLAVRVNLKDDDGKDHGDSAGYNLVRSGLAISVALGSLIKSLFSLILRPIATLAQGYQKQDCDRFVKEPTKESAETLNSVFL